MVSTGTPRPWSPTLSHLRPARLHVEPGDADEPPVLLHHGFLIETAHVWRQFAAALHTGGRSSASVEEHYLRTIDSAHALGHDPDLALAQSLAAALDAWPATGIDVAAEGTGAGPALLLALNDARVRRVVLWRPAGVVLDDQGRLAPAEATPLEMTDAEVSIGVTCTHAEIETLRPTDAVQGDISRISIPVLIIDHPDSSASGALGRWMPSAEFVPSMDPRRMLADDLLIQRAMRFLALPVGHAQR
ncbi:hypothetical protein [Microbacterium protaetiae]|uniref:hypothetical protein n=1 Tax=Microbacterium protaetiae TaxID=2509458 RepID=UPI0013EA8377|nr:hypothetical protein [Microbacterium protaetiae]